MKDIATGLPDFERLISTGNAVYVDKTEYIYRMVSSIDSFFFVSRPRRFGKSLMCSTLDALFSGKRELFKGLYIDSTDYSFEAHPVLRFDFSGLNTGDMESFRQDLRDQIDENAVKNDISLDMAMPSSMMRKLLLALESPVIIIDEFDSPMIDAVSKGKAELAEVMRDDFNSFYKVIKSYTGKIRFLFITGCTKLSGLSIFSAMNNLDDISADPCYAGMSGYTEDELLCDFGEHIDEKFRASCGEYKTRDGFISALRDYYDGYCFSPESDIKVYNPVSIGKYLSKSSLSFSNYWMSTGGMSTLAVTLARNYDLIGIVDGEERVPESELASFDIALIACPRLSRQSVLALLYYAGYLTITGSFGRTLMLDFPNTEVRTSFLSSLVRCYTLSGDNPGTLVDEAVEAAVRGDIDAMVSTLNEYYRSFNYDDLKGQKEQMVRSLFKAFLIIGRQSVLTEVPAGQGRLDALLVAGEGAFLFEFKVDGKSAQAALDQILERHYHWLLTGSPRQVHLIGLDFRTDRGQIVSYTHKLYGNARCCLPASDD